MNIPGIHFFNVPPEDIAKHELELQGRFQAAKTVKGTQQFHRLVPVFKSKLHAYKLSLQSDTPELVSVQDSEDDMAELPEKSPIEVKKQKYVCCLYDNEAWVGLVEDVSEEHGDFFIRFMTLMDLLSLFIGQTMTLVGSVRLTSSVSLIHHL